MSQFNHIMLDIETLGLKPGSMILSLGACQIFKPAENPVPEFYIEFDIDYQEGWRQLDMATLKWWSQQETRAPFTGTANLEDGMRLFNEWCTQFYPEKLIVWANGTDFDICHLTQIYESQGIPIPWKYNNVRDFRTVRKLFDIDLPEIPTAAAHNALEDAKWQAAKLRQIFDYYAFLPA